MGSDYEVCANKSQIPFQYPVLSMYLCCILFQIPKLCGYFSIFKKTKTYISAVYYVIISKFVLILTELVL
jgi:hypothetical protein